MGRQTQLRDNTRSRSRSPSGQRTYDNIQTDDNRYTEVFSWGADTQGQLGLGLELSGDQTYLLPKFCSYNISIRLLACGDAHTVFVTYNNYVYAMGANDNGQLGIDDPVRFKNSPVLIESIPAEGSDVHQIACGGNHSFLVCGSAGEVYSWGEGSHGALGLSTLQDQFKPKKIQITNETRIL